MMQNGTKNQQEPTNINKHQQASTSTNKHQSKSINRNANTHSWTAQRPETKTNL